MRHLLTISFLFSVLTVFSQNPFDQGKTKDYYYLSLTDIDSLGIYEIRTVVKLKEKGGMHQNTDFSIISFKSAPNRITDYWHIYDDSTDTPELEKLLEESRFINGEFWEFENGVLQSSGMEGYGTLCENYYERDLVAITKIYQECKGDENGGIMGEIMYFENGVPKFKTKLFGILKNEIIEYTADTLFYIYDSNYKIIGTKLNNENDTNYFFKKDYEVKRNISSDNYNQMFINDVLFEHFIKSKIGYTPDILVFEIYRFAVFTFKYDKNEKKYFETNTFELE